MDLCLKILDQLPAFVTVLSPEGKVTWVNRTGYGIRKKDVLGRSAEEVILEEDRVLWWELFRRALRHKEVVDYELRVKTSDRLGYARISGTLFPIVMRNKAVAVATVSRDSSAEGRFSLAAFMFCPLGRKVVSLLSDQKPLKGASIGRKVGEVNRAGQASSTLRNLLSSLVDRGILEHTSSGYSISWRFAPLTRFFTSLWLFWTLASLIDFYSTESRRVFCSARCPP